MAKRENQRILLTKRMLQEGLLQLLETKALDAISVTELCRVSGINRATFYNHYSSPADLLTDLETQLTLGLEKLMGSYPTNPEDALSMLEAICAYMKENSRSVIVLSRCHSDMDLVTSFHQLNVYFPSREPKSRLTANMDVDELYLTSTFVYSGCYLLIREWLIRGINKTPREIAELLLRILSKDLQSI